MRRAGLLAALVALGAAGAVVAIALSRQPQPSQQTLNLNNVAASTVLHDGEQVPENFTLKRLGGGPAIALSKLLAGRPAVINVFASWCAACASELDAFASVARSSQHSVSFVGIDTNDPDGAKALQLLRSAKATYPVGIDTADLGIANAFGIDNLPTTLYLNAKGQLVDAVLGAQTTAELLQHLKHLATST